MLVYQRVSPSSPGARQEPVKELRVSGLGAALEVAVQVAMRMERDGIGASVEHLRAVLQISWDIMG